MSHAGLLDVLDEQAPEVRCAIDGGHASLTIADASVRLRVHERGSVTPAVAARLVGDESSHGLVIADMIHSGAEETLREHDWSYWDRRGRLRLWLPEIGLRLDVPTRSYVTGTDGPDPRRPVSGTGGISVGVALMMTPHDPPGVREVARLADMAPSTISRARAHLIQVALIDPDGAPVLPELFWATSDAWVPEAIPVSVEPDGTESVLAGDAAAAHWGAPMLAERRRYYCSDRALVDRHRLRHRSDSDSSIEIALAPTPIVTETAIDGVVHPVVAALDLSTSARGRDVLTDWTNIDAAPPGAEAVWQ